MGEPEPVITINGHLLNDAQAMTLRVAVQGFLFDLVDDNALGDDEHGKAMVSLYRQRLDEINNMILRR